MSKAYDNIMAVISKVAAAMDDGYEIIRSPAPKELCFYWIATKEERGLEYTQMWKIRLSEIKRLRWSETDPRIEGMIFFVHDKIDAKQAQQQIQRLEKLKAFW